MKNILIICACLFTAVLSLSAQQPDARQVLDRATAAFRKAGGIQADFTISTPSDREFTGTSTGVIRLKGEKFFLDADGVKTWFDGRTQWSYLVNSDEVNISEPTQEELQSINPYALLSIYKQGYSMKLGAARVYGATPAYEVILTASDGKPDLQRIALYIARDNYRPLGVYMTQKNGSTVAIAISHYVSGRKYADTLFVFNKKEYPAAEVIDLR